MNTKNFFWNSLKKLSDLNFSIAMFLLIACVSVLGTIIEQDKSIEFYKSKYPDQGFFFLNCKSIIFFGLNHVYSNLWFLILIFFFFISLILCTFSTQLPILKNARRWKFLYSSLSIEKMIRYKSCMFRSVVNFVYLLNLRQYYVFHRGNAVYAYKGLIGRIAPIFVHLSIIVALTGSVIGLSSGFLAQEFIPSSELFHIQNIIKSGYLSVIPSDLLYQVNDFYIVYNKDGSIKQFFSDISVIKHNGYILYNKQVSVNHPLRFKGLTFYQTDWKLNALRLQIGENYSIEQSLVQTDRNNKGLSSWFCLLRLNKKYKIFVVVSGLNNSLLLYDENANLIKETNYGVCNIVYGIPIVIKDVIYSTGLQIKIDPGIYIAYMGFSLLMMSIILSYISYSQIWSNNDQEKFYFSGKTNRAILSFENEIIKIYKKYLSVMTIT